MGYSERYCHLCGVSFNIGRIRTKNEPRSSAWSVARTSEYTNFVDSERNSHIGECKRNAGCMVVYREDIINERWFSSYNRSANEDQNIRDAPQSSNTEAALKLTEVDTDDQDDEDFLPDAKIMQRLDFDEKLRKSALGEQAVCSPSWNSLKSGLSFFFSRPNTSSDGSTAPIAPCSVDEHLSTNAGQTHDYQADSVIDSRSDSMDYEYASPAETCSEYEPDDMPVTVSNLETDETDAEYWHFQHRLREAQDNGKTHLTDQHEDLMLPLFRPLNRENNDEASESGTDGSFECDLTPDTHEYNAARLDHRYNGKTSYYKHPLTKSFRCYQNAWEHVAGQGCVANRGYHGDRISVEEMSQCNTLQCLVQKKFAGTNDDNYDRKGYLQYNWQSEADDEPWERDSKWCLSGLSDFMPSRDDSDPRFFPERHGTQSANAENCRWDTDDDEPERPYCMPFHPYCLETFKRASLKRFNHVDIDALGSWWALTAEYHNFHSFPRSEAVKRGEEQWWRHNPGDEHLAADACYVPTLQSLSMQVLASDDALGEESSPHTRFNELPAEILINIYSHLETTDIARFAIALPTLRNISHPFLRMRLHHQYPWLWELYDQRSYSKWTGVTSYDLKESHNKFNAMEAEIQECIAQLETEEWHDLARDCREYWDNELAGRRAEMMGTLVTEKPVINLGSNDLDIAKFVLAFVEAWSDGRLKGLENRARIWKDCNVILDQIEDFKGQGKIVSS